MAEIAQVAPIINSAVLAGLQILGGTEQRAMERDLAKHAESIARADAADQKRMNRILLSSARARMLQAGTDELNLGILAQLALEGERRISRIKDNAEMTAWYYRNQADASLYDALGNAAFTLGEGFASAYERGLFTKDAPPADPFATPGKYGTVLPSPGSGGSTTLPATGGPASPTFEVVA